MKKMKCFLGAMCDDLKLSSLFVGFNPGPALRTDPSGKIVYANPAAKEIFDISNETLLSRIIPSSGAVHLENCIKKDTVLELQEKIGNRHFLFNFKGVSEIGALHVYGTDITRQKEAEERLTAEKTRAEEATLLKDKFVAIVAHDLKSPLAFVVGMLRLLTSNKGNISEADRKARLEKALRTSEFLIGMIDTLLDLNRLRSGEMAPVLSRVNAADVAGQSLTKLAPLAEEKGIRVENRMPEEVFLQADPDLLGVVVQNLVSNAIKFSRKGDKISISVPEERPFSIAVKDTGVGMDRATLSSLFSGGGAVSLIGTNGERGTGLGLQLSHDIIRSHGGSISAESEVGQGSAFYIELPSLEKPAGIPVEV